MPCATISRAATGETIRRASVQSIRGLRQALIAAAVSAGLAATGCGSAAAPAVDSSSFAGDVVPARPAPPIDLRDYRGREVTLAGLRRKAVLVAFLYTHCPDLCPLVAGKLHTAESMLGRKRSDVRLLAVSVDPKGDTRASSRRFDREHQLDGELDWLLGSRRQLGRTWKAWRIAPHASRKDPEVIEHSADIFGIDASGRIRVLYPPSFKPSQLARDLPKLAAE